MIKHTQIYDRHSVLPLSEVLHAIQITINQIKARNKKPSKTLFNGHQVNLKSLRLQTFLEKGLTCVTCGRTGTHFALERQIGLKNSNGTAYHVNLWATDENGDEYLMTHDHILARSLGGKDAIENTQTMCSPCNAKKGVKEQELKELLLKLAPSS